MKSRLTLASTCRHSAYSLLFSRFLSKNMKIKIKWTIIFSVVSFRCKNCSVTFKEERRLRAFENGVLRKILGAKQEEVTADLGSDQYEDLHDCCCSRSIVRVTKSTWMIWAEQAGSIGKWTDPYRVLVRKPERKRPLGKYRRRWGNNIRPGLKETCRVWTGLIWFRKGTAGGLLWTS